MAGNTVNDDNYVFFWDDGEVRKMVLTSIYGKQIKSGEIGLGKDWSKIEDWEEKKGAYSLTDCIGFSCKFSTCDT